MPIGKRYPLPNPLLPSISTISRSLASPICWKPSSRIITSGLNFSMAYMPALCLSLPTITGMFFNLAAIRYGSSPASSGPKSIFSPSETTPIPFILPLYPLLSIATFLSLSLSHSARCIVIGVLPLPPTVILPMEMTLQLSLLILNAPIL